MCRIDPNSVAFKTSKHRLFSQLAVASESLRELQFHFRDDSCELPVLHFDELRKAFYKLQEVVLIKGGRQFDFFA